MQAAAWPPFAGILGAPYLEPASVVSLGAVQLDVAGAGATAVFVPPDPALSGLFVHLQGIELGAAPAFTSPAGLAVL